MNAKINNLLSLGKTNSKKEAEIEFDLIYNQRLKQIRKKIDEQINTSIHFDLIFCRYAAYAKQKLPNMAWMMTFVKDKLVSISWTSCGFYKSNLPRLINYDLPKVFDIFKTIDKSEFVSFYAQCCLNLYECVKHIHKFQGNSEQKLSNELAKKFNIRPKKGVKYAGLHISPLILCFVIDGLLRHHANHMRRRFVMPDGMASINICFVIIESICRICFVIVTKHLFQLSCMFPINMLIYKYLSSILLSSVLSTLASYIILSNNK